MAVLSRVLQREYVNARISRIRVQNTLLQNLFGCQQGGANERQSPVRSGSVDIFDETRDIASATLPGTENMHRERFPVGHFQFNIPRHAGQIDMLLEHLNQLRPIGGPAGEVDTGGQKYILDQERNQKMTVTNLREFQIAAMLRGSYTWTRSGRELVHDFSGGSTTVDYQIPASHKNQIDPGSGDIIGVSWDNPGAPIVRDLFALNQFSIEETGRAIEKCICNSTVWGKIVTNTEVQNLAGAVNNPVASETRSKEDNATVARLVAVPWLEFNIYDHGLNVGTNKTYTRLIADTQASFVTSLDGQVVNNYICNEPIVDPISKSISYPYGEYYDYGLNENPAVYRLRSFYNGLPVLFIPKTIFNATVVF